MASAATRSSPQPRRVVPIKRADGEPLTRGDIQYDFLNAVFGDSKAVFTDPYASGKDGEPADKVCFRELYIKAILHSPKATKALKDKMGEPSSFAADFGMLSLLVNVGRVNTTMSFFPEMKTTIRTYHPIPSLQRTNGNMQDAPRIKHILKTSLLDGEGKSPPATPGDVLSRAKDGPTPSTSVTNLIFVLAHHTGAIGQAHFHGQFDFMDFFLRTEVSSVSRAQAFLWLCYNYLESPAPLEDEYDEEIPENPFCDPVKKSSPPSFIFLTQDEMTLENQESTEDIAMTDKLMNQRTRIVQTHGAKEALKGAAKASAKGSSSGSVADDDAGVDDEASASVVAEEPKPKGKKATVSTLSTKGKGKRATGTTKEKPKVVLTVEKPKEIKAIPKVPDMDDDDQMIDAFVKRLCLFTCLPLPRLIILFRASFSTEANWS
ncbi:hypothetical protein CPB83DRAFT_753362 [Crepidotus variabilis]|uniref:Uncharacterized protein n=1 Tax=Crepidotus variabilis TaxID=179855 RepID=A0A9P6EVG9_9AGAR|nr:hypothetical protein CPB83DRAFT_753362 [Crepidotus variabilis]